MSKSMIENSPLSQTPGNLMKAVLCEKYGKPEVLELKEVEKPAPKEDEVFVKIHAASVNPADWHMMRGGIARVFGTGVFKPKDPRIGGDFAGQILALGSNITQFHVGDDVFGGCKTGSFAEYGCAREIRIAPKPRNMSYEEAASIPIAGLTALQALRDKGQIQPGMKVLINGASGGVGTFAVQIAKAFDTDVTAVCSTKNLELVRSLGADHVIDYTKEDFAKTNQKYDLICDIAASHPIFAYKRILNPSGRFILVGSFRRPLLGTVAYYIVSGKLFMRGTKKFAFFIAKINTKDLEFLKELVEQGKMRAVVDRRYELKEIRDAMEYLGEKHARGKIVIRVN